LDPISDGFITPSSEEEKYSTFYDKHAIFPIIAKLSRWFNGKPTNVVRLFSKGAKSLLLISAILPFYTFWAVSVNKKVRKLFIFQPLFLAQKRHFIRVRLISLCHQRTQHFYI
jgi:hypothetical protein